MTVGPFTTLEVHPPEEGVRLVLFNRPERLNALDTAMHFELERLFFEVERDHETRVLVLSGKGRGFCAGGDFADPENAPRPYQRDTVMDYFPSRGHVYNLLRSIVDLSKPAVAAVNGPAAGIGAVIAWLADVVFMAEDARIGDRHTRMAMTAGDGASIILPLLIGLNRAKEILMSGEMVGAAEAYRLGMANHVVPGERLMDEALGYARRIAALPELGVRTTKVAVNKLLQVQSVYGADIAIELFGRCFASAELEGAAEGFREGSNRG